ncbi:uncharacterized protein K489DRAFT_327140 [Dissoconium aciculare CBS 342.82]|uniref:Uncharacterized protein n=1 Tax=Dissoconium aciculare CBS 342.82 TaxID=1314786 RepID=A0A6J3LU09_9PEZI|nr:uncharacterized protein K489DRAFT_327140 [Dissoconium aciculare CBS 342.82]KAF1818764.1 hypothetical protein K489DRAFT_327140 [Dissoconium aciculare CBS 342.82]
MTTHNDNPDNFANRPNKEVRGIASEGGKAFQGGHKSHEENDDNHNDSKGHGRNPDGTFTKGSQAAAEVDHKGGQHSHQHDGDHSTNHESSHLPGRNPDGTFTNGSEAAAEAGHIGCQHSHKRDDSKIDDNDGSSVKDSSQSHLPGRNPDGTFINGSQAAAVAGHKSGQHS